MCSDRKFGFFLPDAEYLADPEGLIKYLGAKLSYGKVCVCVEGEVLDGNQQGGCCFCGAREGGVRECLWAGWSSQAVSVSTGIRQSYLRHAGVHSRGVCAVADAHTNMSERDIVGA